jgi:predicted CoA-binding protein
MFKTIVVATDLSLASDHVIGCLRGLLGWGVKEAVLVHALGLRHLVDTEKGLAKMAEPKLAEQKALLQARGFRTDVEVAPRSPSLEVNRIAKEREASLVAGGYTVLPINPKYREIDGIKCYGSLKDLPEKPEVVISALAPGNTGRMVPQVKELGIEILRMPPGCWSDAAVETCWKNDLTYLRDVCPVGSLGVMRLRQ